MFERKPYTYSVDWWALGIVLFECTYNMHPFSRYRKVSLDQCIQKMELKIPLPREINFGKYPFEFCLEQQQFIEKLLEKKICNRLGCSQNGFQKEIQCHDWFVGIDWGKLYLRELVPEFIPDVYIINKPNQNNFDFGPALEELLYESAPLKSKPVKKKKPRFEPLNISSLWEDEQSLNKKKEAAIKLERELEYIEEYFLPFSKVNGYSGLDVCKLKTGNSLNSSGDSISTIIDQFHESMSVKTVAPSSKESSRIAAKIVLDRIDNSEAPDDKNIEGMSSNNNPAKLVVEPNRGRRISFRADHLQKLFGSGGP